MAVERSDLMKLPKEDLADGFTRMANKAKKYKEQAVYTANNLFEIALAGGAAWGVGYWIGNIKGQHAVDGTDPSEDLKVFGLDKDLAAGLGLTVLGLGGGWFKISRKFASAAQAMGTGILAYWAGSAGERMAIERATEPEEG